VNGHPDDVTIFKLLDADPSVDQRTLSEHLERCSACQEVARQCSEIVSLLRERDVFDSFAASDADRAELRKAVLENLEAFDGRRADADAVLPDLLARPMAAWDEYFEEHPQHRTVEMARRLLAQVDVELNRRPEEALLLIGAAERIANRLPDQDCRATLGDVWKQRSNALRHLFRYEEALDAAEIAEAFYASLPAGDFDAGQARYTRAVTLFKMQRYSEALQAVASSATILQVYGDTVPLAKTIILDGGILIDTGAVAAAQQRWRDVLPMLERLGADIERARVLANLAECSLRLGQYDAAMHDAERAVARYRQLGMETECIRSEWTIGIIHLASGASDAGLDRLETAAAAFESRGMSGDAGFVKLDMVEELLRREAWSDAELLARDLVNLFARAGVTVASVNALEFLRQAVEHREASAATVRYVREYVSMDDPQRPFDFDADAIQ
jgi:tetratricopeptide (TPR) repeat protein